VLRGLRRPVGLVNGSGPRGAHGLDEKPERVLARRADGLVVFADAENRREDVRFSQRLGKIRALARLTGDLEIDETIEGNRGAVQAFDRDAVLADVRVTTSVSLVFPRASFHTI
jgi:hypothetical protein